MLRPTRWSVLVKTSLRLLKQNRSWWMASFYRCLCLTYKWRSVKSNNWSLRQPNIPPTPKKNQQAFGVIKRDRSHGRLVSGSGQKGVLTKLSCGMQGDVTTSSRGWPGVILQFPLSFFTRRRIGIACVTRLCSQRIYLFKVQLWFRANMACNFISSYSIENFLFLLVNLKIVLLFEQIF